MDHPIAGSCWIAHVRGIAKDHWLAKICGIANYHRITKDCWLAKCHWTSDVLIADDLLIANNIAIATVRLTSIYNPQVEDKSHVTAAGLTKLFYGYVD
jgi:hypothetical protein